MDNRLSIGRINCQCLIPKEHPLPAALRDRVGAAMRGPVAGQVGRMVEAVVGPHSPAVWLIRRLDVALAVDAGSAAEDELARVISAHITQKLAQKMAGGDDGEDVLYFPNRAAYLAYFLNDLANGDAWDKWHYAEFDGLRLLPASSAIAETFLREPDQAESVLRVLAEQNRLERVLGAMSENAAARVLAALAEDIAPAPDEARAQLDLLVNRWNEIRLPTFAPTPKNGLRVLARMPSSRFSSFVLMAFLAFAHAAQQENGPLELLDWTLSEDEEMPARPAQPRPRAALLTTAKAIRQMAKLSANELRELAQTVAPRNAKQTDETKAGAESFVSAFCGVFLLLPAFQTCGAHLLAQRAAQNAPDPEEASAALRLLMLLKCMGGADAALRDPALLLAAGATARAAEWLIELSQSPPPAPPREVTRGGRGEIPDANTLAEFNISDAPLSESDAEFLRVSFLPGPLDEIWSRVAREVMRAFGQQLAGFGHTSAAYLHQNFLAGAGQVSLGADEILADVPPCPLRLILQLGGFDNRVFETNWTTPRRIRLVSDE